MRQIVHWNIHNSTARVSKQFAVQVNIITEHQLTLIVQSAHSAVQICRQTLTYRGGQLFTSLKISNKKKQNNLLRYQYLFLNHSDTAEDINIINPKCTYTAPNLHKIITLHINACDMWHKGYSPTCKRTNNIRWKIN